tara:strand:- start:4884 stop:5936 length:1053 start_codon:yes stop_codon:yes gene_type:complete
MNKRKQFKIGNYVISEKNPPFIIAEVGQAHKGSIKKVFKFIDELASTGINAIKFQTHYADHESTLDEKFRVQIKNFKTRYDYWKSVEFSKDEWLKIKKYSNKKKLIFLSSVFSLKGFNILNKIGMPAWKIASGEYNSNYILKEVYKTKKPLIISTGLMNNKEIYKMHKNLNKNKIQHAFLHCVSNYPVKLNKVGLNNIESLNKKLDCPIGYSDHSGNLIVPINSMIIGAKIIEIHAKLQTNDDGPDSSSSLTINEIKNLCHFRDGIQLIKNNPINKDKLSSDLIKIKKLFSKSFALNKDMKKGSIITSDDLTFKKPGTGYDQSKIKFLLGKKLSRFVSSKVLLRSKHFKK